MGEFKLPWPCNRAISAELCAIRETVRADRLHWKVRDAAMRESLVARGVMPAEWLSRAFKGRLPSFKNTDEFAPSFIQHDAMYVLMHDPARVLAAEAIARAIFAPLKPRFIWTTAQSVRLTVNYVYTVPPLATTAPKSTVVPMAQGVTGTPAVARLIQDVVSWDVSSYLQFYQSDHHAYAPLRALGVFPWVIAHPEHPIVSLQCAFNFERVVVQWRTATYAGINDEAALAAVREPSPFEYMRRTV